MTFFLYAAVYCPVYIQCRKRWINPHFPHGYPQLFALKLRVFRGFPQLSTIRWIVDIFTSTDFGIFLSNDHHFSAILMTKNPFRRQISVYFTEKHWYPLRPNAADSCIKRVKKAYKCYKSFACILI